MNVKLTSPKKEQNERQIFVIINELALISEKHTYIQLYATNKYKYWFIYTHTNVKVLKKVEFGEDKHILTLE